MLRESFPRVAVVLGLCLAVCGGFAGAGELAPEMDGAPPPKQGKAPPKGDKRPAPPPESADNPDAPNPGLGRLSAQQLKYALWLEEDSPAKAEAVYARLLEEYPDSPEAMEANFGRGRCLLAMGRLVEAFDSVEKSFPGKPKPDELAKRTAVEMKIGRKLAALGDATVNEGEDGEDKKKESGYTAASRVFAAIVYNDPDGREASAALMAKGEAEEGKGDLEAAQAAYARLIQEYPLCRESEAAHIAGARCLLKARGQGEQRSRRLLLAEEYLRAIKFTGTQGSTTEVRLLAEAKSLLEEAKAGELLEKSRFYMKDRNQRSKQSAAFMLRELLQRYPNTASAEEAKTLLKGLGESVDSGKD